MIIRPGQLIANKEALGHYSSTAMDNFDVMYFRAGTIFIYCGKDQNGTFYLFDAALRRNAISPSYFDEYINNEYYFLK